MLSRHDSSVARLTPLENGYAQSSSQTVPGAYPPPFYGRLFLSTCKTDSDARTTWTKANVHTEPRGILVLDFLQERIHRSIIRKAPLGDFFIHIEVDAPDLSAEGVSPVARYGCMVRTFAVFSNFLSAFLNPVKLRIYATSVSQGCNRAGPSTYPVVFQYFQLLVILHHGQLQLFLIPLILFRVKLSHHGIKIRLCRAG